MATKNDLIIKALTDEIIRLEYYGHTHVVQRIDENIKFLERVKGIATAEETEFDLSVTATNTTVVVTRDGTPVTAGTDVLDVGDIITITATAATGYTLSSLTLNGIPFTSGGTYTVTGDVVIVAASTINTYDLSVTATNATVSVTRGGQTVSTGTDVLSYGDVITITAIPNTNYQMSVYTVNGTPFVNGTLTVTDDVTIVATATLPTYNLSVSATNATVSVTRGGSPVTAGSDVLSYGDVITITASAESGYEMSALTVNGVTFTSGNTYTVTGDVAIIATAEQAGPPSVQVTIEQNGAYGPYAIYDGNSATGAPVASGEPDSTTYQATVQCTSGYLCVKCTSWAFIANQAVTGGVTYVSGDPDAGMVFTVSSSGTIWVELND